RSESESFVERWKKQGSSATGEGVELAVADIPADLDVGAAVGAVYGGLDLLEPLTAAADEEQPRSCDIGPVERRNEQRQILVGREVADVEGVGAGRLAVRGGRA